MLKLLLINLMIIGSTLIVSVTCDSDGFDTIYINPSRSSSAVQGSFKSKNIQGSTNWEQLINECDVINQPSLVDDLLANSEGFKGSVVTIKDEKFYDSLVLACSGKPTASSPGADTDSFIGQKTGFIVPGTKWCGGGNMAKSYDDLGISKQTDACCREHDHCTDFIPGGETKYGLTNKSPYTASNCSCDDKFKACLKKANNPKSNMVGNMFFNVLKFKCFREAVHTEKCLKYDSDYPSRCAKFEEIVLQEKVYALEGLSY